MKPSISLLCSIAVTTLLIALAWLLLFPVYDGNDDVAIRLFLDGRGVPGAEPSGYAYFVNLALGQLVASLYTLAPGISWYDVVEQGTLVLTTIVALYCCIRSIRFWDDAAIVLLIAAMMLAAFAAIRFTIVAALGAAVGLTALTSALLSPRSRSESFILSTAGAFLIMAGTFFRLEAALLGILIVVLAGLPPVLTTFRARHVHGKNPILLISLAALIGIALAWSYHLAAYLGSSAWNEFYYFNFLRGQLSEYAAARLPPDVLNEAFAAAGWTSAEHDMLREWVFFDPNVFSTDNMRLIFSKLPALPSTSALNTNWLLSYGLKFPFFVVGILGVILTAPRLGVGFAAAGSLATIFLVIVLISIFLKPLDYAVFWPIAAGMLLALWAVMHLHEASRPKWVQRLIAALLLVTASVWVIFETVERARADEQSYQVVISDLTQLAIAPGRLVAIIGSAFPLQIVERPFGPPYFQRAFPAVAIGATLRAPPIAQFLSRVALPDMASWLCSEAVLVVAYSQALDALGAYYQRYRHQAVSFTSVFKGKTFSVYQCRVSS